MGNSVLVVDDDPVVRDLLSAVLSSEGHQVLLAADGEEALRALASSTIDLVLLDSRLPGESGVEILRRLRLMPVTRTLPVILVTGDDGLEDRVSGLAAGADDYIVKPFAPRELVARVTTHLRSHHAWQNVIDGHLEERATVARVLEQVAHAGTLDERASAVCDALAELPSVKGAALVVFDGEASASVLSVSGSACWTMPVGAHLPPALARYLLVRASVGPWIERGGGSDAGTRLLLGGVTACAPIGERRDVGALLALAVHHDPSRVLAAAVDFATMTQALLRPELDARRRTGSERAVIEDVIREESFTTHFQPIVDIVDGRREVGVEALTRFHDTTPPDLRFRQAAVAGLGLELERVTLACAVRSARSLRGGGWLSLNVSPSLAFEPDLADLVEPADRPVILELSEQEAVSDYSGLRAALDRVGPSVRLSIDDAGSGFASLRHILALEPEFVKLDRSWVHDVDEDLPRQALIAGLQSFCERTGAGMIAEGIETERECATVADLGVALGQGYLLGKPAPADL